MASSSDIAHGPGNSRPKDNKLEACRSLLLGFSKFYNNPTLSDIIIRYGPDGKHEIRVHKVVLCAVSSHFDRALNDPQNHNSPYITLRKTDDRLVIEQMISSIYGRDFDDTAIANTTMKFYANLYLAAMYYQIHPVAQLATDRFYKGIRDAYATHTKPFISRDDRQSKTFVLDGNVDERENVVSCVGWLLQCTTAQRHKGIRDVAFEFIEEKFEELIRSGGWKGLIVQIDGLEAYLRDKGKVLPGA